MSILAGMDRTRWEILVLAAAILVGALAIASSMRANRYAFGAADSSGVIICDTHTGQVFLGAKGETGLEWTALLKPVK